LKNGAFAQDGLFGLDALDKKFVAIADIANLELCARENDHGVTTAALLIVTQYDIAVGTSPDDDLR
jgi:hypothetical protein